MFGRSRKIKDSLTRTRQSFFGRVAGLFGANEVTEELWEELEELLIQADVGVNTTVELVERLRERVAKERVRDARAVEGMLKEELIATLDSGPPLRINEPRLLTIILVVGANGSGKTTSIAKLAHYYREQAEKSSSARPTLSGRRPLTNSRSGASELAAKSSPISRGPIQGPWSMTLSGPLDLVARIYSSWTRLAVCTPSTT